MGFIKQNLLELNEKAFLYLEVKESVILFLYIEFGNRILNFSNKCDIGKHHGVNYLTGQVKKERQRILAFRFATFQEVLCYVFIVDLV